MAKDGLTIHLIGNSHIDPVWLWRRPSAADEVINTSRTVCTLLDDYPDFIFSKGEAWGYSIVERHAPDVFERIRAHVDAGRWHIVNGWWIQPDCNFPLEESFRKHAEIGGRYFAERFGQRVRVGYNPDSFGHSAYLPRFLSETGMDYYVFMRPGPGEMELPTSLFRWASPDDHEVTAFRIVRSYASNTVEELRENIEETIRDATPGVGHTMCFFGVGDHGGGPTREQIEWLIEHRDYSKGVRLEFSHPLRFFETVSAAILASNHELPLISGELQHHAIGCYSVAHRFRQKLRLAEQRLLRTESHITDSDERDELWKRVLFNQFHDITGGCSIASAMEQAEAEVSSVISRCDDLLDQAHRTRIADADAQPMQRIVVHNPGLHANRGPIEIEPWLGFPWVTDREHSVIDFFDESGVALPSQPVVQESPARLMRRYLIDTEVPAGGTRTIGLLRRQVEKPVPHPGELAAPLTGSPHQVSTGHLSFSLDHRGVCEIRETQGDATSISSIRVPVVADESDTWSHGIDRYAAKEEGCFSASEPWHRIEAGPLRWRYFNRFDYSRSWADLTVSFFEQDGSVELGLRLYWAETMKLAKLEVVPNFTPTLRLDRVPGGMLERELDGRERPIQHITHIGNRETGLTLISNDIFAGDIQPDGSIRLTLVRSPYFAHHLPYYPAKPAGLFPVTDQGMHEYRISIVPGARDEARASELLAIQSTRLCVGETTRGMDRTVESKTT